MKRRELLGSGTLALLGVGVTGTALGYGPLAQDDPSRPAYLDNGRIVYEHDRLQLRAQQDVVRRGDTITFEITNTGESNDVSLGCHNPWAIQYYEDGEWNHAVWTGGRYYLLCLTSLSPGGTYTEEVTLSDEAISEQPYVDDVDFKFTPGKYRFVVVGSDPYLAVNFRIEEPSTFRSR